MNLANFPFICLLGLGLCGCVTQTSQPTGEANTTDASFHTLMAEVALQRRQFDVAAEEYVKAAQLSDDPEVSRRATQVTFTLENHEQAYESAKRWLELDNDSSDALRFLANLSVKRGEVSEALGYLQRALQLAGETETDEAFLPLTTLLMREDDTESAKEAMAKLAEEHDENARAHFSVALLALQSRDYAMALSSAKRARELAPDWPRTEIVYARALIANNQIDEGLQIAKAVAERTQDVGIGLEYGGLLVDTGRNEEARGQLEWVLEQDPESSGARFALGLLEMRERNLDAAQAHFTKLLASGRRTLDALFYLGSVAELQEDYEKALPFYVRVQTGTYATTAQIRVARMLFKLNQEDAALAHLKRRKQSFPDEDVALSDAEATLLGEAGRGDDALAVYDDAIARHPESRALRFSRSFLLEREDRVTEAIAELTLLLEEQPDDPVALNALGYTLADRTDDYEKAYEYIRRALELVPGDAAIIDSMGWVQYRMGNNEQALDHLRKAYEMTLDPEVAAHLGEVLWVQGETEEAKSIWEKSFLDNPDHKKLKQTIERFMP